MVLDLYLPVKGPLPKRLLVRWHESGRDLGQAPVERLSATARRKRDPIFVFYSRRAGGTSCSSGGRMREWVNWPEFSCQKRLKPPLRRVRNASRLHHTVPSLPTIGGNHRMKRKICQFGCCLLVLTLLANHPAVGAPAEDSKDPKDAKSSPETKDSEKPDATKSTEKPAAAKPAIHTVKKGPLKIEASLDGVFEAQNATEVILRPKVWATLKVLKAAEHGTAVKRGDLLVTLDTEKIDRAIADLRAEHKIANLGVGAAEQALATLEKTTPMDLAAGLRAHQNSQDDLDYYLKVTRPLALKSAEFSLKSAEQYVEYQREEVRQLEKMYKADDLTEETEEIILKRARNALERAEFSFKRTQILHERTMKVEMPRRYLARKESAKRAALAWNDVKAGLPVALQKQRLELKKTKIVRERSEEKLNDLLADRAAMIVKAPCDGIVYYGKAVRGKFSSTTSTEIRAGGAIAANKVFMTIVQPRPLLIRASVAEKDLGKISAGIKGTAQPTGFPDMKLSAIVNRLGTIPMSAGGFDARIAVALDSQAEAVMPGMTCKVKLVTYQNPSALTVPPQAVSTDESDERKHYVHVVGKKGKSKKRYVKVGKRTDKAVEILEGLSEGDKILSESPKK